MDNDEARHRLCVVNWGRWLLFSEIGVGLALGIGVALAEHSPGWGIAAAGLFGILFTVAGFLTMLALGGRDALRMFLRRRDSS